MTEILSSRRLNRALLARQQLLERAELPIATMVERMGGIQMQYAPSGYIGLWTRLADFQREALTRALEARDVVQGTLMRGTIHTVSARDYWPMAVGLRESRREWLERVTARERGTLDMGDVAAAVRELLADGPLPARTLETKLAERGLPARALGWSAAWIEIVRVPPSGTWQRRRADLLGLAEQWLPNMTAPSETDGVRLLLERYLAAFGPARVNDFADWAGVSLPRAKAVTAALELVRYRSEQGRELIDLPGMPLPAEDVAAPARFLPTWDAALLVHARRTQILPEQYRPRIFNTRMPQSIGTFLVDGQVAGTWRYEPRVGRIQFDAFERLPAGAQRDVEAEAEALAAFHGD